MEILEHPYQFFFALAIMFIGLGAWLDRIFVGWRIKRLKERVELLKLGL